MKKKAEGRRSGWAVWFYSDELTNMARHAQAKADYHNEIYKIIS